MGQLRPLRIGEALDAALRIYRRNAIVMMIPVALVAGPLQVISGLISASTDSGTDSDQFGQSIDSIGNQGSGNFTAQTNTGTDFDFSDAIASLSIAVLGILATALATAVCFKIVIDVYLGRPPDWRESLRFSAQRFRSLAWILILTYLLAGLALLPFVIPGVWLFVSWLAATPVLLAEGVRGRRALGRSFSLVRGRWWPTFGTYLLGSILAAIVTSITVFIFPGILLGGGADGGFSEFLVGTLTQTVASVITTPFLAALVAVIYFDLRVRKEGFDLELLAADIGVEPPGEAAPEDR